MQHGRVLVPGIQSGAWWGGAPAVLLPPRSAGDPRPPQGCSKQEPSGCFCRWPGLAVLGLAAGPGTGRVWERRWSCHLHPNRFHNPGEDGALWPPALPHPTGGSGEQEAEGPLCPFGRHGGSAWGKEQVHALHGSWGSGGFGVRPDPARSGVSCSPVDTMSTEQALASVTLQGAGRTWKGGSGACLAL